MLAHELAAAIQNMVYGFSFIRNKAISLWLAYELLCTFSAIQYDSHMIIGLRMYALHYLCVRLLLWIESVKSSKQHDWTAFTAEIRSDECSRSYAHLIQPCEQRAEPNVQTRSLRNKNVSKHTGTLFVFLSFVRTRLCCCCCYGSL